jgi:hypothetical protein
MKSAKLLVVVLACAGFLFAQTEGSKAEEKKETKTQERAENAGAKMLYGKIVSVDAMMNTVVIKVKNMDDTLSVETGAKIMSGKKEIPLNDLKAGASVTVTWKLMNGKKTATKIVEPAAKPMK